MNINFYSTSFIFLLFGLGRIEAAKLKARECQEQGFNPSNLACSTCDLLPSKHQSTCLACCESFRDVSMIQKPYESAVLMIPGRQIASEEIKKLLDEDWDGIVEDKGKNRMRLVEGSAGSQGFYFGSPPSYIFFFESAQPASVSSLKALESAAKESISLGGWKREDIRDMLRALLP